LFGACDFDVFVNEFTIVENLTAENENFDNVVYKKYQDMFLLNPIDKTSANSPLVADYLPSHLLYSIEDYLWDLSMVGRVIKAMDLIS